MTTKFQSIGSKFQQAHKRRIRAMSVSQTGCILHRKAGQLPPDTLLENILKENPTGWGAATLSEVDGKKFFEINSDLEAYTVEEFKKTCKDFKNQDITFYFCSSEVALSIADLSPHVLIETTVEEDPDLAEPQMLVFIDGNFPGSVQTGSSHPPEYHLVEDMLRPKFEGLFEMVDGDIDKLMEQVKKPFFKKELMLTSVSRGVFTLLASNGEAVTFAQNDLSVEGEWGWVSNGYGFGKEEAAPVADKPKRPSLFKRGTVSTVREKPATAAAPAKIAEAVVPPKTETAVIPKVEGYTVVRWQPQGSYSRKEKRNAYKMRIGYCPVGWQDNVEIDVFKDTKAGKLLTFSQVKALGPITLAVQQLAKNPPRAVDTDTDHVNTKEAQTAVQSGAASAEILPIMSPKGRERVNDIRNKDGYKKIIAENAEVISDPKQAETYETKFANFAQQIGASDMKEFGYWSHEMRLELGKIDVNNLAVMCTSFANLVMKHADVIFKAKKEEKQEETPVTTKRPSLFKRNAAA